MKVGLGSYAYRWAIKWKTLNVIGFIEKAISLKAGAVQICDNLPLNALSESEILKISYLAHQNDIEIELGIKGPVENINDSLLEKAKLLNTHIIRIVIEYSQNEIPFKEITTGFKFLVDKISESGISIAIENHFCLLPNQLLNLIHAVDNPLLSICLDPVNSISNLICPDTTVEILTPFTISVHAKDVIVKRKNTGFYIAGCPLGKGMIDWKGILTKINKNSKSPNIFLESWMDQSNTKNDTLHQEHRWVVEGINYLQKQVNNLSGEMQ